MGVPEDEVAEQERPNRSSLGIVASSYLLTSQGTEK